MAGGSSGKSGIGDGLPAPGDVVEGRYVIESVLGSGTMGVVVRARHKALGHLVAIKFVKPQVLDDEVLVARFTREAKALVSVESDHVVRVHDFGELPNGTPYMVMEYLTGHDLNAEIRARRELPVHDAVSYVIQACKGLSDVHAHGVVHRDIKPANLFLTRTPAGTTRLKLVDFGISKAPKKDEDLTLTQHWTAIGSPQYMAPEQFRDAKNVDHRADIWALGVILHRTITGNPPFEADSVSALFAAVAADAPTKLREEKPELPAGLEQVILKCLEKKPEDRYQDADALARALEPYAKPQRHADGGEEVTEVRRPAPLQPAPPELSMSEVPAAPRNLDQSGTVRGSVLDGERTEPRRKKASRALPLLAAAAALAVGGVFLARGTGLLQRSPSKEAPASSSAALPASSTASAAPTAITDLPQPPTSSPEAAAAYKRAMQAIRDASLVVAEDELERATLLDPSLAAAHLRAAVNAVNADGAAFGTARAHFQSAYALRAALSPRDLGVVDALAPLFLGEQPDAPTARAKMDALVRAAPGDAELAYDDLLLFDRDRTLEDALAAADAVLAIDPKFASAWWVKARRHELADDGNAALRDVDACLAASPGAASCLAVRAVIESYDGACEALETDARRMVKIEIGSYRAEAYLAGALFARGYPLDAVTEALSHKAQAIPDAGGLAHRRAIELADQAHLAALRGDFVTATKLGGDLAKALADAGGDLERADAARLLVDAYVESGDGARAAQVADAFLEQRGANAPESPRADPRPELAAVEARGGLASPDSVSAARDQWLSLWTPLTPASSKDELWIHGWAAPAATKDDAVAALSAMAAYQPVHTLLEGGWTSPLMGKLYLLAGRAADAVVPLRAAAAACDALDAPFANTQSKLGLGEALEATGDKPGACAAYASVLVRWGKASPKSVTADTARARAAALGC